MTYNETLDYLTENSNRLLKFSFNGENIEFNHYFKGYNIGNYSLLIYGHTNTNECLMIEACHHNHTSQFLGPFKIFNPTERDLNALINYTNNFIN